MKVQSLCSSQSNEGSTLWETWGASVKLSQQRYPTQGAKELRHGRPSLTVGGCSPGHQCPPALWLTKQAQGKRNPGAGSEKSGPVH